MSLQLAAASAQGFDAERLARLPAAIEADVEAGRIDGAVVVVARAGTVILHQAMGFAERARGRDMQTDDVFMSMSIAKQFTNLAVLQCIDRGNLAIDTPVAAVIPEFAAEGKGNIRIGHLITHTSGLPPVVMAKDLNQADLASVTAVLSRTKPMAPPGEKVMYSPLLAHGLLAEVVRRLDGGNRRFGRILADDVFEPLGMNDTALGIPDNLRPRYVPVVVRDQTPGLFPPGSLESSDRLKPDSDLAGGGATLTAMDLYTFAEMWRLGGKLEHARLLSPAMVRFALEDRTGTSPHLLYEFARELRGWPTIPSHYSYGFWLRGHGVHPMAFGHLASPGTFGGLGAGCNCFWVDPVSDVTFVLLTAGLLEESASVERFRRLSDLVHTAIER